jgi:acyl dehydratase
MSDEVLVKEGYIYGPWRKAINAAANIAGSIHDDAVAKRVGMRGGVVAGTVHLDLFPPVLVKTFGQRWFEQGSISLYFTYALLHDEEVRVVSQAPPKGARDAQVETRLESPDGRLVARGTVSVGEPKEKPYLQTLELESSPREKLRIFKELEIGWEMPLHDVSETAEALGKSLKNCEDTVDWYSGKSPWGPAILPPSHVARLMMVTLPFQAKGVAFYGANELRFVNGPVKVDVPYRAKNKIIAVGVTSKTEYFWFDSQLYEKATNKLVAEMHHMTRCMKAGSPLYPEVPEGK